MSIFWNHKDIVFLYSEKITKTLDATGRWPKSDLILKQFLNQILALTQRTGFNLWAQFPAHRWNNQNWLHRCHKMMISERYTCQRLSRLKKNTVHIFSILEKTNKHTLPSISGNMIGLDTIWVCVVLNWVEGSRTDIYVCVPGRNKNSFQNVLWKKQLTSAIICWMTPLWPQDQVQLLIQADASEEQTYTLDQSDFIKFIYMMAEPVY